MSAENEVEVRLIDVLETFARTPPSPGNAGVMDALSTSTGAKRLKILEAMWSAEDEGLLQESYIPAVHGRAPCCELPSLGRETLEKLQFDERTRIAAQAARDILGDIEAEMAGLK